MKRWKFQEVKIKKLENENKNPKLLNIIFELFASCRQLDDDLVI